MGTWLAHHIAWLVGLAATVTIIGIGLAASGETTNAAAFISARQMYGLTAFGVLLGACLIGPLTAVFPRMPGKGFLLAGRRAIGVSAFVLAVAHVVCYVGPVLLRNWRELYEPGLLWMGGLGLGLLALADLSVLAWTSRDAAVKAMGGKRWKRLHRSVYIVTPVLFLHAWLIGADFGFAAPSSGDPDEGSLIVFSILTTAWLVLAWLRGRGIRWPQRTLTDPSRPSDP